MSGPTDEDLVRLMVRAWNEAGSKLPRWERDDITEDEAMTEVLAIVAPAVLAEAMPRLYERIKHGDEKHRAWLLAELTAFAATPATPPTEEETDAE